jgi:hypothetical protein
MPLGSPAAARPPKFEAFPARFTPDPAAAECVLEFLTPNIGNRQTRKAYAKAAGIEELQKEPSVFESFRSMIRCIGVYLPICR